MKLRNLLVKAIAMGATVAALTGMAISHAWAQDLGKQIYDDKCAGCHGPGGKGDGPAGKMLQPAPREFSTVLKGKGDDYIQKVIKEGGEAVGKSPLMPASKELSADQVKSLVQYIKSF